MNCNSPHRATQTASPVCKVGRDVIFGCNVIDSSLHSKTAVILKGWHHVEQKPPIWRITPPRSQANGCKPMSAVNGMNRWENSGK